jgi:cytochrome c551/c552
MTTPCPRLAALLLACLPFLLLSCGDTEPDPGQAPSKLTIQLRDTSQDRALWGEAVFAKYSCSNCHTPEQAVAKRVLGAPAPNLASTAERLTRAGLVARLQTKGSAAHGQPRFRYSAACGTNLDPAEAETIANWLAGRDTEVVQELAVLSHELGQGQSLFNQLGCRACHSGEDAFGGIDTRQLAEQMTVAGLTGFLADPQAAWPSGKHPSFGLDTERARMLSTYLVAGDRVHFTRTQGIRYQYFEQAEFSAVASDWDALLPVEEGIATTIGLQQAQAEDHFGLRFMGSFDAKIAGAYRFYLTSDDGSRLSIDGKLTIDNWGLHGADERSAELHLDQGMHSIEVLMFEQEGGEFLELEVAPPGQERRALEPSDLYSEQGSMAQRIQADPMQVSGEEVAVAEALFAERGCASCHAAVGPIQAMEAPPLADLERALGCVANDKVAGLPDYDFQGKGGRIDGGEGANLSKYLDAATAPTGPLDPETVLRRELERLNCLACHTRGGEGGVADAALPYFRQLYDGDDLGAEGKLPPSLDGVGAKLQQEWLATVIAEGSHGGAGVRPYVAAQMPGFGREIGDKLAEAFAAVDLPEWEAKYGTTAAPFAYAEAMEAGRALVGSAGLMCIVCHDVAGKPSLGIPMVDLAMTTGRLRYGWFREWVEHPTELRPGSRMAGFWIDGKSAQREVLEGEADAQIAAIWTYLSLGDSMPLPIGLVLDPGAFELTPIDSPIYHACFLRGASARGMAVGFPQRKHLAFDYEHLRLDSLWYGDFVNASATWDGRAGGLVQPGGEAILDMPPGLLVAELETATTPWPTADKRAEGWRLLGHKRSPEGMPTFRYAKGAVLVEESLRPVIGPGGHFVRRIRVEGAPAEGFYLRIGAAQDVVLDKSRIQLFGPGLVQGEADAEVRLSLFAGEASIMGRGLQSRDLPPRAAGQGSVRYLLNQDASWKLEQIPGATSEVVIPITPGADGVFVIEVSIQW